MPNEKLKQQNRNQNKKKEEELPKKVTKICGANFFGKLVWDPDQNHNLPQVLRLPFHYNPHISLSSSKWQ